MRLPKILLCFLGLLGAGAATESSPLERLATCLTGTFSSAAQARGDLNFRDVTLHVATVWPERSDGPWLYAEQALADAPNHPYRQRLYRLATRPDGALELRTYEIADPIAATGAWKEPGKLAGVDPAALTTQDGCVIILKPRPDGSFQGGTVGQGCTSTLRNAAYVTTEAILSPDATIMWERGYTSAGTQVSGSLHGGYLFKRVE